MQKVINSLYAERKQKMLQVNGMKNVGFKSSYELPTQKSGENEIQSFKAGMLAGMYGLSPNGPKFPVKDSENGIILNLPDNMDSVFEDHCTSRDVKFNKLA